ncbi:aldehyde ferredoxin oxidoreductase family protein [[Eubacterium] cellulosolvens]
MSNSKSNLGSIWGKLLRVNLCTGKCTTKKLSKQINKDYLGGRGLGVKIIYDQLDPRTEPLSAKNILIFATGPLTGTTAPTGGRYEVITKSPLTGTITGANAGGYFGAKLKKAGFDGILIDGKARNPVYLYINNDDVELRTAGELWGLTTQQTTEQLEKGLGISKISVACIGPAGENLVKFASIINDKHRAAGRGGAGAVMGSKNLKAIVVYGSKKINIINTSKFRNITKKIHEKIKATTVTNVNLREFGTAKILDSTNDYNLLGTRNFQQNFFEHAKSINAEKLKKTILIGTDTCFGCPIACKRVTQVGEKIGQGPEFETLWAFGAQCGIEDIKAIARANYLCNEFGLDTISTGNTIGCAMELHEKGVINEKIKFGDANAIEKLTEDIAFRKGIGDKLAEGSFRFASSVGYPELSMSVKNLEMPAYDPRGAQAQGLGYATSTRGACHVRAFVVKSDMIAGPQKLDHETINTKTKLVKEKQDLTAVIDSIGMCLFSSFVCDKKDYWIFLEAAAGLGLKNSNELLKAGERIWTLERLFNLKVGFTRLDDTLPIRFKIEKVQDSLGHKHSWPEKELIDDYYKMRGWTKSGVPTKKKLKQLDI